MTQRIEHPFLTEIKTPPTVDPEVFNDAGAAVAALQKLYDRNTAFLRDAFEKVARGEIPPQRYRAYYPEICLSTSSFAHVDSRLAYGHVSTPGDYSANITRPDLFDHYLNEQIRLLMRNHGVTVTVKESSTPIPIHFAFKEGTYVEASVANAFTHPLRDLFDVPDLAATDDKIVNAISSPPPANRCRLHHSLPSASIIHCIGWRTTPRQARRISRTSCCSQTTSFIWTSSAPMRAN